MADPTTAAYSPALPRRWDLGGFTMTLMSGGGLKLDGGAMFGIVPKPLWERAFAPDDQNRINLACNCLLLEFPGSGRRVIIETGHGPKYAAKEQAIFGIDPATWLLPSLRRLAIEPESISDVILSHLHFDHAGGLTREQDGRLAPTFPAARVHVQRREFDDARANFGIMTITYREENFTPIDALDGWNLLDGDADILPGIRALPTPGHTRGHHSLLIRGRDQTALFVGDVMPTRHHVRPPYNMGYDLFPLDNRASKQRLLSQAARADWLVVLDHEPVTPVVRVRPDGDSFVLAPVE